MKVKEHQYADKDQAIQKSYAAVEEDCTSGLVIEVFDDSDKVRADVVLLHGCPQSCMPNPVKGLLEVYEDMVVPELSNDQPHQSPKQSYAEDHTE